MLRTSIALACALLATACSHSPPPADAKSDISGVLDVKSSFGPGFAVSTVAPTGIDPRLLAPQAIPPGAVFDPPACAKDATGLVVPPGIKGNMAATTAEGNGNRFIAIAIETSQSLQFPDPGDACKKVAFAGGGVRGLVEVVDSPAIDGVHTLGTHRVVQTKVADKLVSGELYDYVATFATYTVIVTANPLVDPGKPVAPVDTQRARDLLTAAVKAVRGS
ncbi:hypothetical protein MMAD_43930 [Mycolicibacterium madagascariense]|uniref:DUF5642 domain-containing protein n=1 Tax=Mycolicibacterium madagascariense TaxID=212765 RepID=A0A7I7XLI6_9MYCO|nr:DUF5642 family protein [Mycolicibacterium madagascariense]MCV7012422.1 DUF5642 family protein [Mycolicibacterium madagascariense]BBZ30098.1 hypothetical protein MMAD_43930 [Mycolicibacterium madagascariense]